MKRNKCSCFFCGLLCILITITACSPKTGKPAEQTAQTSARAYNSIKIGAVQPGPENYYQTFFDRIQEAAKHAGMSITTLLSEYSTDKELRNVEDLISQGVDCIAIFPLTSDSAQQIAQICNAAEMPLFLITAEASPGPGVVTCSVKNDFFDMGYMNGVWLKDNFTGPANILEVQGALGTGIGDNITAGFTEAIKDRSDYKVVFRKDCQWDRATAITFVEDQISAGTNFNVVFVHNEDMCGGVVSVLQENNLQNTVMVITQNGSDDGFKMLDAKQIACTVTNSPSLVAGEAVVRIMQYFDGTLKDSVVDAGVYAIDQSNYKDPATVTWDVSWALQTVDKYIASK
jgi:ABC-type sugar transport system substrate-binding protein